MFREFFHFNRYLTPSIIRLFYLLHIGMISLLGLFFLFASLGAMASSFIGGVFFVILTATVTLICLLGVRIATEAVMILFQNNEHLAALRARAEGR